MCAFRLSSGLVNAMQGTAGDNFRALMNGGWLDLFTGSQPISADYVETGAKLCRVSSTCGTGVADGLQFGTAASGILPIGGPAWQGTVGTAGVIGWGRFYSSSGTAGSSVADLRFDVAVAAVSGGDLNLTHTDVAVGSTVTITSGSFTQPKE